MAYSFGTQGALPNPAPNSAGSLVGGIGSTQSTTPQSRALSSAAGSSAPQIGPSSLAMLQAAGTPKSQTITDASGNTHAMTYVTDPASGGTTSGVLPSSTPAPSAATGAGQPTSPSDPFAVTPAQAAAGTAAYGTGNPGLIQPSTGSTAPSGSTLAPQAGTPTVGANPTPASVGGILGNLALNPNPDIQSTIDAANAYKSQVADALQTVGNTPGPLGNQLGREANINSAAALQEQANAEKISALTTLQGTQQSGLASAGGLLNPSNNFTQVSPGNIAINNQGQPVASAPTNQLIGQTVQVSPTPNLSGGTAGESSSYTIKSGDTLNAIAAQYGIPEATLQAANPNAVATNLQPGQTLTIPSSGSSNQYGSGPAAAANVGSIQDLTTQKNTMSTALNQADLDTTSMTSLIQANGLNPSNLNIVNGAIQAVGSQTSNSAYKAFATYANDLAAKYATLITPIGGNTTNLQTEIAQSLIDSSASAGSIQQVISALRTQAANNIDGINKTIAGLQNGGSTAVSSPQPSTGGSGSTGSVSAGGYSFVQNAQGQWIAQ